MVAYLDEKTKKVKLSLRAWDALDQLQSIEKNALEKGYVFH